jgi:hypothetical protein
MLDYKLARRNNDSNIRRFVGPKPCAVPKRCLSVLPVTRWALQLLLLATQRHLTGNEVTAKFASKPRLKPHSHNSWILQLHQQRSNVHGGQLGQCRTVSAGTAHWLNDCSVTLIEFRRQTHVFGHSSCTSNTSVLVKHKRVVGMISNKQTMAIRSTYISFYRHSVGNELVCMCKSAPFPQHGKYPHVTNVCRTN